MAKITLRHQKVEDAKRFYEILNNPNFIYFAAGPKSLEDEIEFIKKGQEKTKNNVEHCYTIMYDDEIVGGCGIKINHHREYIGEIGYFLDENYWGKGITTEAVKQLEKIGFDELGLSRIEIIMVPENKASEKVAIKCGYEKEGLMKKYLHNRKQVHDAYLYAKAK